MKYKESKGSYFVESQPIGTVRSNTSMDTIVSTTVGW